MKSKIFHNKRALSEFILDLLSYFVFVTALFFFFVVYKFYAINQVERQLKGVSDVPSANSNLINYLRTNVVIESREMNVAELIRLWNLEPTKYKDALQKTSIDLLNSLEYEYIEPQTRNKVIRGFHISINKEKIAQNTINPTIEFKSKSFEDGFCIRNEYGCVNLGEQFIPISESSNLYIVLREAYKSK